MWKNAVFWAVGVAYGALLVKAQFSWVLDVGSVAMGMIAIAWEEGL